MSVLTIDVGNSHTVMGLFGVNQKIHSVFRIQTNAKACSDELYVLLERLLNRKQIEFSSIKKVVLGTVVLEVEGAWRKVFSENVSVLMADYRAPWGFAIALPQPQQLGSDRLANAEAGLRFGSTFIVVDAGTATTFDVVGPRSDGQGSAYLGGAICPGVGIAMDALVQRASRLSAVSLFSQNGRNNPPVVGNDTESAVRSGVIRGFNAMVNGMVGAICEEQNFPKNIPIIATGGFSNYLRGISTSVTHFEPNLTLEGLYAISQRN